MVGKVLKVVLDTNILISAIGFGGKPREIFLIALEKEIQVVSSRILLAEFFEVISKKFPKLEPKMSGIERKIKKSFLIVHPKKSLKILKDEDDDRVLEAALEGKCDYIVTGDRELLKLGTFQNIQIVTADWFIQNAFKG